MTPAESDRVPSWETSSMPSRRDILKTGATTAAVGTLAAGAPESPAAAPFAGAPVTVEDLRRPTQP